MRLAPDRHVPCLGGETTARMDKDVPLLRYQLDI